MKSLQQNLKDNGQDPNLAYQAGKLEFNKKAGCLVYCPPRVDNSKGRNLKAIQDSTD